MGRTSLTVTLGAEPMRHEVTSRPRPSRWTAVGAMLVVVLVLAGCGGGPSATGPDLTNPIGPSVGLTGPVGPVARSCRGVAVTAADDVQQVINAHPPGTTFCLSAGTYRLVNPLVPKRGDALVGRLGAVLNGSKVLTGWQKHGSVWSTRGFLPAAPDTHGLCAVSTPLCTYTQDVFFDKRRLRQVASSAAVTAGTVYADYSSDTITIGDNPRSHLIEQAVAPSLVRATVNDVTVENLVVEEAANEAQFAAIQSLVVVGPGLGGSGWRILHNEVRLNHGVGIGFASGSVVADNLITDQGQLGFGAHGAGSVVTNNEISFNNASGYSAVWEAGGGKSWLTSNDVLTHNYVYDNMGPGLWDDGGNIDTTYEYNLIVGNWGAGIQHEISYDVTIKYNEISGNGFGLHQGWAWDAGIQIQSSGGIKLIDIADNVVVGNYNGITVLDSGDRYRDQPMPYGPHLVQNVWVHDNIISMSGSEASGAVVDDNNPGIFNTNHNRFNNNTYYVDSLTAPHFAWDNADGDWSRWRSYKNDLGGQAELLTTAVARLLHNFPHGVSGPLPGVAMQP